MNRRRFLGTCAGAAAIGLSGCGVTPGGDDPGWSMFQADAGNTGHRPDGVGPTGPVDAVWRVATGEALWNVVDSSPAVADGLVFAAGLGGGIEALDAEDGTLEWQTRLHGGGAWGPSVVDGTVYLGTEGGSVFAVDRASGTIDWRFDTDGFVFSSPAVTDEAVYLGSGDGRLYAIELDGDERWRVPHPRQRVLLPRRRRRHGVRGQRRRDGLRRRRRGRGGPLGVRDGRDRAVLTGRPGRACLRG